MPAFDKGRILITGGAGFIGSALVWALNKRGCDHIMLTDCLGSDEKWRNLVPLRFDDYCEADRLFERLPKLNDVTAVFHLGACSATTERNARYLMENNYAYTRELAHWAQSRGARFIYASSAATYGDGSCGMDDGMEDLGRLRPLNMYGYSKHIFDLYARRQGWLKHITGLKYFNVFGPNEDHKAGMRSVVHKAFCQIRDEGRVALFKSRHPDYRDGEQMRDFLYVKDAVAMTLHLAAQSAATGLFNVGSGRAHTWLDLVRPIFAALDIPEAIDFVDMPEALQDKYQYYTCADIGRLRKTGYNQPCMPLAEAVKDYVCGYLQSDRRLGDEAGGT